MSPAGGNVTNLNILPVFSIFSNFGISFIMPVWTDRQDLFFNLVE